MGAGRSGTTALATFLNFSSDVIFLGELHQLPEYARVNLSCSCGEPFSDCSFWSSFRDWTDQYATASYIEQQRQLEAHRSVVKYLNLRYSASQDVYHKVNIEFVSSVNRMTGKTVLDSAKYVGRALALSRIRDLDLRVIYLTRDPRGVVESFSKQVQKSRGLLSSCLYYNAINLLAEVASRFLLKGRAIKVRYEDLFSSPHDTFGRIGKFCDVDVSGILETIESDGAFEIGHIVGGNRLKSNKSIRFRTSDPWRRNMSRITRTAVYLLTIPFALLNRYEL